ncbi:type II toxin-antitoxin system RelE/ParE family toxin [Candidatus Binatus sp.]|uniref:type II toxin-antitoxin system RelE/ParE family toxin n=1 Tax=Candidatus Binatus sp. TaxID=2811406 RepID=UPI003F99A9BB
MITSFRHKGLKELSETGKSAKIDPRLQQRCSDVLDAMEAAVNQQDLNLPGFNFHPLKGKPVRYSIHVNGPWSITFEWNAPNASRVDLEQYH